MVLGPGPGAARCASGRDRTGSSGRADVAARDTQDRDHAKDQGGHDRCDVAPRLCGDHQRIAPECPVPWRQLSQRFERVTERQERGHSATRPRPWRSRPTGQGRAVGPSRRPPENRTPTCGLGSATLSFLEAAATRRDGGTDDGGLLAGEVLGPGREFDDGVVDGPEFVEHSVSQGCLQEGLAVRAVVDESGPTTTARCLSRSVRFDGTPTRDTWRDRGRAARVARSHRACHLGPPLHPSVTDR